MELQEKEGQKFKAYRKSLLKELTVNRYLLILDLKPFRSDSSCARKETVDIDFLIISSNGDKKTCNRSD